GDLPVGAGAPPPQRMTRARGGRSWLHANGDDGTWPRTIYAEGLDLPDPWPPLDGDATADLCVVGGGITALEKYPWRQLRAADRMPGR
ncbi:MAG: hypothetical protein AAF390_12085, partial [Pseudomonadota bacterium]